MQSVVDMIEKYVATEHFEMWLCHSWRACCNISTWELKSKSFIPTLNIHLAFKAKLVQDLPLPHCPLCPTL